MIRSGRQEGMPYSLSRWTDVSGKWGWFESCLEVGRMIAFDPRTASPGYWSLSPEETLGLLFWTKQPAVLVASQLRLEPYNVVVNVTANGWEEVEKGAPKLDEAGRLLVATSEAFKKVYWRMSPIPLLPTPVLLERFTRLLAYAEQAKLREVFVSFLQSNDRMSETRTEQERFDLLNLMSERASSYGVAVVLCQDDRILAQRQNAQFSLGICAQAKDFEASGQLESCGCIMMVDPFTINEACNFSCSYCYAADKTLSVKKRNTTKLRVMP